MDITTVNLLDLFVICVIAISAWAGVKQGLVRGSFELAGWILAAWFAYQLAPLVVDHFPFQKNNPRIQSVLVFGGIFVVVLLAAIMTGRVLHRILIANNSGLMDRLSGGVFGFVRGVFIVSALLLLMEYFDLDSFKWWKRSELVAYLEPVVEWLDDLIPKKIDIEFSVEDGLL